MMVVLCGTILITTNIRNANEGRDSLGTIITTFENRLTIDDPDSGDGIRIVQMNRRNSFVVLMVDNNGEWELAQPVHVSTHFTQEVLRDFAIQILETGNLANYMTEIRNTADGKIVAGVYMGLENEAFASLTLTVLSIGAGGLVLLFVLVWFLSYWIVNPAKESLQKQARFISEASHEIKTPLTIISAGLELLDNEKLSPNAKKWLEDIKTQTGKMTTMTTNLLEMSKLNEGNVTESIDFDLSSTVLSATLSFESVAFEQDKKFKTDIQDGVIYRGDPQVISQAVSILCDNAIKHSDASGDIEIKLSGKVLTVSNSNSVMRQSELPLLFERFYRGSESRAKTQGTGLGLAILKDLADKNNWRIDVKKDAKKIIFTVTF